MTALQDYERLEATGLWRPGPHAQRRDVIVSIGDATLVITDIRDRALTHWSLPAVSRANPGKRPAIYHPDGDPGETLELGADEAEMIAAIEKLRSAIARRAPRPGRIRLLSFIVISAALLFAAVFWLPGALRDHTLSVVPKAKRAEIGASLLAETRRLTGAPCTSRRGDAALEGLRLRLGTGPLVVVREGVRSTLALPGGTILIGRAVIEDYEDPDVLAGFVAAELVRTDQTDPLARFLDHAGLTAIFRLLTTGAITDQSARAYAEAVVPAPAIPVSDAALLKRLETLEVRSRPYAFARDITGETTLGLIEADPFLSVNARPILSDGAWVGLQGICES